MEGKLKLDKHAMKDPATAHLRIYVGGLKDEVTVEDLHSHFIQYGEIDGIILNRVFGFVQFNEESAAQNAINNANGSMILGKKITVRPALQNTIRKEIENPSTQADAQSTLDDNTPISNDDVANDQYDSHGNFIGDQFPREEEYEEREGYKDWYDREPVRGVSGPRGRGILRGRGRGRGAPPGFRDRSPKRAPAEWSDRGYDRFKQPEYPRALPVPERNDCEIIVVSKALTRRVSRRQLETLWNFLRSNKDVATAYNRSLESKEYSSKKWKEITVVLNSHTDGARKDWRGWSKYWVDYKAKMKIKATSAKSIDRCLSELEGRFLEILGDDFVQRPSEVYVKPLIEPTQNGTASIKEQEQCSRALISQPVPKPIIIPYKIELEEPIQELPPENNPPFPHLQETPQEQFHSTLDFNDLDLTSPLASVPSTSSQPKRRRRRLSLSHEAARRALVRASQMRAEAAIRNSEAMEKMVQHMADMKKSAERIEREYAEYIEGRLKRLGIVVDLLFPMEDVPIGKVLGNIASRGCLYAILVMPLNQENRSLTLTILHGLPQEHRNMPLEDALQLLSRNFQEVQRGGSSGREAVYALLGQLADGRTLTVLQYEKVIEYLQERKEQQVKIELGEPLPAAPSSKTQVELQQRILSILNDKKPAVKNDPPPAPPQASKPDKNQLLNDPTVKKALDSILQRFV